MCDSGFMDFFGSIIATPEECEKKLNEEWRNCCLRGDFRSYDALKQNYKLSGKKVYRNSQGLHKVK